MQIMSEKIPRPNQEYLTEGKWYDVKLFHEGVLFTFVADDGGEIVCTLKGCVHLGGGDWQTREV